MQKHQRVIIIFLVVIMLFSAFATGILLIWDASNEGKKGATDDTAQVDPSETDSQPCVASAEAMNNQGNAVGPWPYKTEETSKLITEDLRQGDGDEAQLNDCITVHYRLALADGTPVAGNDTFAKGQPVAFDLVEGGLIPGWTQGIPGMKVGGVRRLVVPPELGYGDEGSETIPGGSTLVFEVELVEVQ